MHNTRLRAFFQDDRRLPQRLTFSLPAVVGIVFTFVLFGMLDLFLRNADSLPFLMRDLIGPALWTALACLAAGLAVMAVLRGKPYDLVLSLIVGLLIAGYAQGNFLNLNLGQLNGDTIYWNTMPRHAVVNLALWMGLVALPFVVYYFSRRTWRALCVFVPLLLTAMQLVGLVSTFAAMPPRPDYGRYLSVNGLYEVSSEKNILVFVVDRLDTDFIAEVKEQQNPAFFDRLDGFTYYPNTTSLYARSYPSIPYLLTGKVGLYDMPGPEYLASAWRESTLLPDLRAQGYTTKLYLTEGYAFSDITQIERVADNIVTGEVHPKVKPLLKCMLRLSAYRYSPHALKPSFWMSTGDFDGMAVAQGGAAPYQLNDYAVYLGLKETGLAAQDTHNNFLFIHLNGSHYPYNINERVEPVLEGQTSAARQTMGCFEILYAYMDQMKALGIYKDATILITGDHGKSENHWPLTTAKTTAMFVKPAGSEGTPLVTSDAPITHANFSPTIRDAAGLPPMGTPIQDVPVDAQVRRDFYYRVDEADSPRKYLEHFVIDGDARNFGNWHKQEELPVEYPFG